MKPAFALAALLTIGCATTATQEGPSRDGSGECDASGLANLNGRLASQQLGAEALRRSGARTIRWIRPGDAVTMDYRSDRLNISLDGAGRVEGFNCG